jgi:GTP-binding protein
MSNIHDATHRVMMSSTSFLLILLLQLQIHTISSFTTPQSLSSSLLSSPSSSLILNASSKSGVVDWDELQNKKELEQTFKSSKTKKDDPEWKFFDTAKIHVTGGDGGNGCVAFRREKGEAMGGPSGGRGGNGGTVTIVCNDAYNTLAPSRNKVHVRATKGRNGMGKNKNGCAGLDEVIIVPPGTVVKELLTQKVAGELKKHGDELVVARGGRGGRGNAAFKTQRYTAPKIAERGEPGIARWLSLELKLVADVGFLGKPNAGKSTLLASASNAKPKIADYAFTTIVPNLGVCDLSPGGSDGENGGNGLVLCDIPGLIEGASSGVGLGYAFLRHVQRCKVLLHVIDGTSDDPIGDFKTINNELKNYDDFLANKPQVVVLNKIDVSEVREKQDELIAQLKEAAGHSRVLPISAATTMRVEELMGRLKKFVDTQPDFDLPEPPQIDFTQAGLEGDSDDFEIVSDPAYPGQWRVNGEYIEQVAKMTHWEYKEAVSRFGRQLNALGIAAELERLGAVDGDLVMVDKYDFEFSPGMTNPYIPADLIEQDMMFMDTLGGKNDGGGSGMVSDVSGMLVDVPKGGTEDGKASWTPFRSGGYLEDDADELLGFNQDEGWDLLDETEVSDFDALPAYFEEGDEVWQS